MIATIHHAAEPRRALITRERYEQAPDFIQYLDSVVKNRDWWHSAYRVASVSEEHVTRAKALTQRWKLLVLSEDWCGDAVNIVPYLARFVESAPSTLEMRILGRDANPDIMNAHLTGTSRAIPIAVALDEQYREHGWWGPRPLRLQIQAIGDWWTLPKDERRMLIRTYYARDRGRGIIEEVLELLESSVVSPQSSD